MEPSVSECGFKQEVKSVSVDERGVTRDPAMGDTQGTTPRSVKVAQAVVLIVAGQEKISTLTAIVEAGVPARRPVAILSCGLRQGMTLLHQYRYTIVFLALSESSASAEELALCWTLRNKSKKNERTPLIAVLNTDSPDDLIKFGVSDTVTWPLSTQAIHGICAQWTSMLLWDETEENSKMPTFTPSVLAQCQPSLPHCNSGKGGSNSTAQEEATSTQSQTQGMVHKLYEKTGANNIRHTSKERLRRVRIKRCCEHLRHLIPSYSSSRMDMAAVLAATVNYVTCIREQLPVSAWNMFSQYISSKPTYRRFSSFGSHAGLSPDATEVSPPGYPPCKCQVPPANEPFQQAYMEDQNRPQDSEVAVVQGTDTWLKPCEDTESQMNSGQWSSALDIQQPFDLTWPGPLTSTEVQNPLSYSPEHALIDLCNLSPVQSCAPPMLQIPWQRDQMDTDVLFELLGVSSVFDTQVPPQQSYEDWETAAGLCTQVSSNSSPIADFSTSNIPYVSALPPSTDVKNLSDQTTLDIKMMDVNLTNFNWMTSDATLHVPGMHTKEDEGQRVDKSEYTNLEHQMPQQYFP
uniref:uncharacterized protein n=1 Tax=Myxine glutinosa TaxID=7769 RepID=UPI00358EAF9A